MVATHLNGPGHLKQYYYAFLMTMCQSLGAHLATYAVLAEPAAVPINPESKLIL